MISFIIGAIVGGTVTLIFMCCFIAGKDKYIHKNQESEGISEYDTHT